jgi:hypothetical protein
MLRLKGNDAHNQQVKLVEKGELMLSRRPMESFKTADYGPCPHCSDWMLKTTLASMWPLLIFEVKIISLLLSFWTRSGALHLDWCLTSVVFNIQSLQ